MNRSKSRFQPLHLHIQAIRINDSLSSNHSILSSLREPLHYINGNKIRYKRVRGMLQISLPHSSSPTLLYHPLIVLLSL
jgi:hypothetical protein